ncbi:MAG: hypothetical protein KDC54_20330, partial [Lewinella sp.]|nr:hypothetical protein [Lewinella sp.]
TLGTAQCDNWNNSPQKEEAENAHVIYRPYVKDKTAQDVAALSESDFQIAFTNWQKAYEIAPTADGQRPTHFIDGRIFYQALILKTEDEAKKQEYAANVVRLYDEEMECFPDNRAFLLGRKAFDMFYSPGFGYSIETLDVLRESIEANGLESEYIVLAPLGELLRYLYTSEQISKEDVQDLYNQGVEIADHNIGNGHTYQSYYESGKANMVSSMAEIESEVFDCGYFKDNLLPKFEENKEDWEVVSYIWRKLIDQGCEEADPDLAMLKSTYEEMYAAIKAEEERIRRENDPCFDGVKLQEEGNYQRALVRYRECLETNEDPEARAQVLYAMAFIQTWKTGQLGEARRNALQAAELKSGWGKPFILIGDIYAKLGASSSCDDWNSRLAVLAAIDKYRYAKSIDGSVTDEANTRIANYNGSLPEQQEGFMRGISAGQRVSVGCGIGETVTVRFR